MPENAYSYIKVPGSYLDSEAGLQGRGFYDFTQSFQINSRIFPYTSLHILSSSLIIIIPPFDDPIPFTDTDINLKLGARLIYYINVFNVPCFTFDGQIDKVLELAINLLVGVNIIIDCFKLMQSV